MKKLCRRILLLSAMFVLLVSGHALADNTVQYCANTFLFKNQGTQYSNTFTVTSKMNLTVHVRMYNMTSDLTPLIQTINNNVNFLIQDVNTGETFYLTDKTFTALEYDVHMTVDPGTYRFMVENKQDSWFYIYFRVLGVPGIDVPDEVEITVGQSETVAVTQQSHTGGYMTVSNWDVSSYSPNPNAAYVAGINNTVVPSVITVTGREVGITYLNVYGSDGSNDQMKVTVIAAQTAPTLLYPALTLASGENVFNDVLGATAKVTWTSSNTAVASVTNTGKITGIGYGTANVTAQTTKNGQTYKLTCKVTVERTDPSFIDFIIRMSGFKASKNRVKVNIHNISGTDITVMTGGAKLLSYPEYEIERSLKMLNSSKVTIPDGQSRTITFTIKGAKVKGTKYDHGVRVKLKIDGRTYYARCVVDEDLGQYIQKSLLATDNWLFSYVKETNG